MQHDTSQIFSDWGERIQLAETLQHYDAASGILDEHVYTQFLTALRQDEKAHSVSATNATLSLTRRCYLVRRSDLPAELTLTSARLIADSTTYEIQSVTESQVPGLLLLECIEGTPPC